MTKVLQGLNYQSKLSVDDLAFEADATEHAILDRFSLTYGGGLPVPPNYGIHDIADPADVLSVDTTRPLVVYAAPSNPLHINVTKGLCVSPNGAVIFQPTLVEDLPLARTLQNDVVVVFMENSIIDGGPVRTTVYNGSQATRRIQDPSAFPNSALLSDFINPVLFTPTRLSNIVVIAVVTVVGTSSGVQLTFDYSNGSYSFNRPWFSPFDVYHRSQLGSGVKTARNTHALSFSDLTSGGFTLYDQILLYGIVQAGDPDYKGIPGKLCSETMSPSRVLVDTTGSVTAGSRFGGVGAQYVVLAAYPTWVTSFNQADNLGRAIAFDWIPETRIVVLGSDESFGGHAALIEYTQVYAVQPPTQVVGNALAFGTIESTNEVIYTGGVALSTLVAPTFSFEGAGPVPRDFRLYVESSGAILASPQLVQSALLLSNLGTVLLPITFQTYGPARISLGLSSALSVPSMALAVTLYGTDASGNAFTEVINFTGPTWIPVSLPGVDTPGQYLTSTSVFYQLTSIQVTTATDIGPDASLIIFAELETETTLAINDLAQTASCLWDGTTVVNLKDKRAISAVIPQVVDRSLGAQLYGPGGPGNLAWILTEDFRYSKHKDSGSGKSAANFASGSITINDYTAIQPGDTLTLPSYPTPTTVTAIISGVPNRAVGQYLASLSDAATCTDLVATLNYAPFNSGFTAVVDATLSKKANLSAQTSGARGNGPIVPVQAIPTSVTSSAISGGIDGFGESFLPRHQDSLNVSLPSASLYDVTQIRGRYLSRAILIGQRTRVTVVISDLKPPYSNIQVRLRYTTVVSGPQWQPWQVLTGTGTVFSFANPASPITRVQLELFGSCTGYSIFEGDA